METVADRIIDALGGSTAVSRKTEIPLSTVHSWRTNGIPRSRRAHLGLVAAAEGRTINWETGDLIEGEIEHHVGLDNTGSETTSHGKSDEVSAPAVPA